MKVPKDFTRYPFGLIMMLVGSIIKLQRMKYRILCCIVLGSLLALGGSSEAEPQRHELSRGLKRPPSTTATGCVPRDLRVRSSDRSLIRALTFLPEPVVGSFDPAT